MALRSALLFLLAILFSINARSQTITSFTPPSGSPGTSVIITGTNFNTTPANNMVSFGAARATVSAATSTSLTVTVPVGATHASITALDVTTGLLAESPLPFVPTFSNGVPALDATSFAPAVTIPAPTYAETLEVTDMDGDGKNDVILVHLAGANNGFSIFPNTSTSGTVSFGSRLTRTLGISTDQNIIARDMDGDGLPDVMIPVNGSGIFFYRNTSTPGALSIGGAQSVSYPGTLRVYIDVADLDNDGRPDMLVQTTSGVLLYRNTSTVGTISFAPSINISTEAGAIAAGNLDSDQKTDIVVLNSTGTTATILTNTSTVGSFSFTNWGTLPLVDGATAVQLADMDLDKRLDVVIGSNYKVQLFQNTSVGAAINFASRYDIASGLVLSGSDLNGMHIGDVNGDQRPDVAIIPAGRSYNNILLNKSKPGTISLSTYTTILTGNPMYCFLADIDGDTKTDLISSDLSGASFNVSRNTIPATTPAINITSVTPSVLDEGQNATVNVTLTGVFYYDNQLNVELSDNTGSFASPVTIGSIATENSGSVAITIPSGTQAGTGYKVRVKSTHLIVTSNAFSIIVNAPSITSFTPVNGGNGTAVTITGTNFDNASTVSFGGTAATSFTVNSSTQITALVASGTSGSVSVTTPGGTGTLTGFSFIPAPTITSFTPASAVSGTVVTITGTNFTGATAVSFGGTSATSFLVTSATQITAVVASGTSGTVSVTTSGGTATRVGFTFIPAPTITSFTPTSAANAASVVLTGTNFTGATVVSFGGTAASSFIVNSSTQITAVVASGTSGSVSVTTPGGTGTLTGFSFIPAPTITSFTPLSAASGMTVTITGTNFTGATVVSFGGTAASSFTVNSSTQITAVVATGTSGTVSVTTPGGTGTRAGFSFLPAPTITSFTPASAVSGAIVTITGTNFTGATAVSFGGTAATSFTVNSSTQITAVVASGTSGSVSVTTPGGTGTKTGFTFIPSPTITSFTPASAVSGTVVTITGTNFTGATAVTFGGTAATSFTVNSSTQITAVVAGGTSGSVSVTTPGGAGIKTGFALISPPTITSFTPASAAGGATVTISGTNFTGTTSVSFGGTAATSFTVASSTSIEAVVDNGTSGNVSVTTPGGTATSVASFTFIPAPTISSFTPASASNGTTITITGTNLDNATAVAFGGMAATSFTVVSSTSIEAVLYNGTSGNVSVTTPGGTVTSLVSFTFIPAPTISSFTPATAASSNTITITGTNFDNATAVAFGGMAATSFTVVSSTSIEAVLYNGTSGNVSVTTPGGTATSLVSFTFIPAPTISSFTPATAASGNTITINGTNFIDASVVTFGGTEATSFSVSSPTTITAVVGNGSSGLVSVTTPGGVASLAGFLLEELSPLVKEGTDISGTVVVNSQSSSVDAGSTPQFNDLLKEFVIENTGTSPLTIVSITSSSNKFVTKQVPSVIQPKKYDLLIIRLDALEIGRFSARIDIQFDHGSYQFNLTGEVISEEIEVFNVVTPNGDGAHDFLKIKNIEYHENKVYLFDRWGDKVFEVENYDNANPLKRFDGSSNVGKGRELNEGTYFYVIDTNERKKKTGFIQLSR